MRFFKTIISCGFISALYHVVGLVKDFYLSQYLSGKEFKDAFVQAWSLLTAFRGWFSEANLSKLFIPILARRKFRTKTLIFPSVGLVCFGSLLLYWVAGRIEILKFFAPKVIHGENISLLFLQIYQNLFWTLPFLVLSAIFGVFAMAQNNLWQMPFGPLIFNVTALIGTIFVFLHERPLWSLCLVFVAAALAKMVFRYFVFIFSCSGVDETSDCRPSGLVNCVRKLAVNNFSILLFIATLRWGYRVAQVWFGSFLPKGQLSALYFCHKIVDSTFPVFGAGIDNWVLLVFSRPKADGHKFRDTAKIAFFSNFVLFAIVLLSFNFAIFKFFPSLEDYFFAKKAAFFVVLGGFLAACTRVLRAFFYSKMAYTGLLISNLIEVGVDLGLSWILLFGLKFDGLGLVLSSATGLVLSLIFSWLIVLQFENN